MIKKMFGISMVVLMLVTIFSAINVSALEAESQVMNVTPIESESPIASDPITMFKTVKIHSFLDENKNKIQDSVEKNAVGATVYVYRVGWIGNNLVVAGLPRILKADSNGDVSFLACIYLSYNAIGSFRTSLSSEVYMYSLLLDQRVINPSHQDLVNLPLRK